MAQAAPVQDALPGEGNNDEGFIEGEQVDPQPEEQVPDGSSGSGDLINAVKPTKSTSFLKSGLIIQGALICLTSSIIYLIWGLKMLHQAVVERNTYEYNIAWIMVSLGIAGSLINYIVYKIIKVLDINYDVVFQLCGYQFCRLCHGRSSSRSGISINGTIPILTFRKIVRRIIVIMSLLPVVVTRICWMYNRSCHVNENVRTLWFFLPVKQQTLPICKLNIRPEAASNFVVFGTISCIFLGFLYNFFTRADISVVWFLHVRNVQLGVVHNISEVRSVGRATLTESGQGHNPSD